MSSEELSAPSARRAAARDRAARRAASKSAARDVGAALLGSARTAAPLLVPWGLLLLGSVVGLPFSLNASVAAERVVGVAGAGVAGLAVMGLLYGAPDRRLPWIFLSAVGLALVGGLWVIAAAGPDIFRGPVGSLARPIFGGVYGRVVVLDPVEVTNTRFIVGYNGLADLCLVVIWIGTAVFSLGSSRLRAGLVASVVLISALLLVGTGSRGGLVGLLAGLWIVGLCGWRRGWVAALATTPVVAAMAFSGVLDKGLEVTSTQGRLAFWQAYGRLLSEVPFTGVGLGVDTANRVALLYEVNPDPERIAYAHNTFVQAYMEQGPLGALGMLLLPLLAIVAAWLARRDRLSVARRALMLSGLGLLFGLEGHGLTDQVVTTNAGTLLAFVSAAMVFAALGPQARRSLWLVLRRTTLGLAFLVAAVGLTVVAVPDARARWEVNVGTVQLSQALLRGPQPDRQVLSAAEDSFARALASDPGLPSAERGLAWTRLKRFDTAGALTILERAAASPRLDAFDMLQVAHLYRELGFVDDAYRWATRAFDVWGRAPAQPILGVYEQSTLADNPAAITLAEQGETALRQRRFGDALRLFQQARGLAPGSQYLLDRVGDAERGVQKYGTGAATS